MQNCREDNEIAYQSMEKSANHDEKLNPEEIICQPHAQNR
jgi:hypothetical protein